MVLGWRVGTRKRAGLKAGDAQSWDLDRLWSTTVTTYRTSVTVSNPGAAPNNLSPVACTVCGLPAIELELTLALEFERPLERLLCGLTGVGR